MGIRKDRLADEIRDVLALNFQGGLMSDPGLEAVTITAVKLSADLQVASVYFRVYLDDQKKMAAEGLKRAAGMLRHILADTLRVRRVPTLRFYYDESIERGSRIEGLLSQIHN